MSCGLSAQSSGSGVHFHFFYLAVAGAGILPSDKDVGSTRIYNLFSGEPDMFYHYKEVLYATVHSTSNIAAKRHLQV